MTPHFGRSSTARCLSEGALAPPNTRLAASFARRAWWGELFPIAGEVQRSPSTTGMFSLLGVFVLLFAASWEVKFASTPNNLREPCHCQPGHGRAGGSIIEGIAAWVIYKG